MTDPTIPELVARLREIDCEWGDNWTPCIGEAVGALHEDGDRLAEVVCELRKALPVILDALKRGNALARAWEEGAEAAFEAQDPGPDSDYIRPLFGRALDEFYASNPYRGREKAPQRR